jgi:release factor glutamine methyltransferase
LDPIRTLLATGKKNLATAGIAEVDAELLLAYLLQVSRMELHARNFDINPSELIRISSAFMDAIAARIEGRPTQYIVGEAPFRYLMLEVGEGVLIPRPETESLVDLALKECEKRTGPLTIVDLGSGTGAIALSLASELSGKREVTIYAVEREPAAIAWLERNCAKLALPVRIVHSSAQDALLGLEADIVIANPPYIPDGQVLPDDVAREPRNALFGGSADGMNIPRDFIAAATRLLKPGGFFAFEHHESQGDFFANVLHESYIEIALHNDLTERPRFTTAYKTPSN